QAEDGIRDFHVTGVQTCALPISVHASFTLTPGEVLGIGGMIGSGRTELFEGLMGLRPAHAARITLSGREITRRSVQDWMAAGLRSEERRVGRERGRRGAACGMRR